MFYGKIYGRKAELGEGFGSGCLNCDLWDLWIFGIRGWQGGRVAASKLTLYGTLEHGMGSPQSNTLRYIRAWNG